ncbi:hypothetical protein JCM3766R1_003739 [Sporobolomyces carnicolor]
MLLSNLLLTSAAFVLSATATTVKHVKLETHTITVHGAHSVATARPFGHHSKDHSKHRHRVESKKNKPRSTDCAKPRLDVSEKSKKHKGKSDKPKHDATRHHSTKTSTVHVKHKPTKVAHKGSSDAKAHKKSTAERHSATKANSHKPHSTHKSSSKKHKETKTKTKSHAKTSTVVTKTASQPPVLIATSSPSLSQLAQDSLKAHNDLRAKHKVAALTWSNELASAAQAWTDKCVYQHGQGKIIGAGENIAAYTGSDNVLGAISMWSNEASLYNFNAPGYSSTTGHFTQQVWSGTTQIGCAQTLCPSLTIPGKPSWTNGYFYVCEYKSTGNIVGKTPEDTAKIFAANVFA